MKNISEYKTELCELMLLGKQVFLHRKYEIKYYNAGLGFWETKYEIIGFDRYNEENKFFTVYDSYNDKTIKVHYYAFTIIDNKILDKLL